MPRFAANLTLLFNELDMLERFAAAAAAGFEAVEILFPYDWPVAQLAKRLEESGLRLVLINTPPGDWQAGERGLAAVPGREAAFRDSMARALDTARALGVPQVHCMAGIPPADEDRARAEACFLANLAWAAERAAARGLRLLIEPLNSRDVPGYFLTTAAQARPIIAAVGADNLFLQFDVYHGQIMHGDLSHTIRAQLDIIGHIQISGLPDRHEPDARQEINYPFLFGLLDELGYDGWIGCEYHPRAGTLEGLAWARTYGLGGT